MSTSGSTSQSSDTSPPVRADSRDALSWRTTLLGADTEGPRDNAAWGAVFAGVAVAMAVLVTFSLIAAALGLGIADPTSDQPFDNVGWAVGLWTILSLAVALAAGGFVSGVLAVRAGFLHGLVVWAVSTLALVVAVAYATTGALGVAGSVVGSVGSAIGGGASTVAELTGDAAGVAGEAIGDELDDVDIPGVTDDIEQVLADSGVPELQPEYLQAQIDEARAEVGDAAREIAIDPGSYEEVLDELSTSLQERVENIAGSVDQEAIATAVAQNTDLTSAEAEQAVTNAVDVAQSRADAVSQSMDEAQEALTDARENIGQFLDDARETLDDASDAAARASLWAFFGLVIGAIITSLAGLWGSRLVAGRAETGRLRFRSESELNEPTSGDVDRR